RAGSQTVVMENRFLRVTVLPEAGARIQSLFYKPLEIETLWQNPHVLPRKTATGSGYDDAWSGGWDDIFPNDEPAEVEDRRYPDHGELWTAEWQYEVERAENDVTLYLQTETSLSGCRIEKWVTLPSEEECLRIRYRVTNLRNSRLSYLWKLHAAMAVSPGDRLEIPAETVRLEPHYLGSLEGVPMEFEWPLAPGRGREIDLRCVPPPESKQLLFFYADRLRSGWCAVHRPESRLTIGLSFPKTLFSSCWLFASYGGWRDTYVAVLEPATGYPFRLEEAIQSGRCTELPPFGRQEFFVESTVRQSG
ncbi:MAG: DUF5107 domain-containing protein, partial [Vicinamibacteraceae bacterium]